MGSRQFHFLLIVSTFFCIYSTVLTKEVCKRMLGQLGDAHSKFVDCMVVYSSPANSCEQCVLCYKNITDKYTNLVSNPNCSKEYINQNRLNIVYNMQKNLVDIWNKGFCDDCFENGTISYETEKFINESIKFEKCLNTNNTAPICSACSGDYTELNSFYTNMDEKKGGKICFDTQDHMNRTRSHWSKDLNCCHREYNLTLFFIASSLFTALPVAFYLGMFGYTKRMERNHEVLDADLNTEHASTSAGVQSGSVSNIEERPSRTNNSSNFEDIDKLKKQRGVSSLKNQLKENSPHEVETLKTASAAGPTSSNEIQSLIDL